MRKWLKAQTDEDDTTYQFKRPPELCTGLPPDFLLTRLPALHYTLTKPFRLYVFVIGHMSDHAIVFSVLVACQGPTLWVSNSHLTDQVIRRRDYMQMWPGVLALQFA
jgi:hypothetical protein